MKSHGHTVLYASLLRLRWTFTAVVLSMLRFYR